MLQKLYDAILPLLPSGETPICIACLAPMTPIEREFYEYRCESCEGKWQAKIEAWREGADDGELDTLFDTGEHS